MNSTRVNLFQRPRPSAAADSPVSAPLSSVEKIDLSSASMDIMNCFDVEPAPLDFVWQNNFQLGSIGALIAAGSTGKSFWATEAAMCVASPLANQSLLNLDIKTHGKVAVLNAEDNTQLLHHRMHAIGAHLSPDARLEVNANLKLSPVVGMGADINSEEWLDAICSYAFGCRLVIVDTHSRFAGGVPENDNALQTGVLKRYELICRRVGCAVLFLHHVGKSMMLEGRQDVQGAARGASAITDAARYQAWMQGMSEQEAKNQLVSPADRHKYVAFGTAKVNAGPKDGEPRWYVREAGGVLLPKPDDYVRIPLHTSKSKKANLDSTVEGRPDGLPMLPPTLGAFDHFN